MTHEGQRYRLLALSAAPALELFDEREVRGIERQRALQIAHDDAAATMPELGGADAAAAPAEASPPPPEAPAVAATEDVPAADEAAAAADAASEASPPAALSMFEQFLTAQRAHAALEERFEARFDDDEKAVAAAAAAAAVARAANTAAAAAVAPAAAAEAAAAAAVCYGGGGAVGAAPGAVAAAAVAKRSPLTSPWTSPPAVAAAPPAAGGGALDEAEEPDGDGQISQAGSRDSTPLLGPTGAPVGPTMAAAVAAAEERWSAERRGLQAEVARLQRQKDRDALVMEQTAALVQMLQETHRALIASNQTLMAQLQEEKRAHADEVSQMHRNFEALKRLPRPRRRASRRRPTTKSRAARRQREAPRPLSPPPRAVSP